MSTESVTTTIPAHFPWEHSLPKGLARTGRRKKKENRRLPLALLLSKERV
jgi:hypothetical protein